VSDYIPRGDTKKLLWLENLSTRLGTYGAGLGLTAAQVTEAQKWCSDIINAIRVSDQKRRDWLGSVQAAEAVKREGLAKLRKSIAQIKVAPGWTQMLCQEMGVMGPTRPQTGLSDYQPSLSVSVVAGRVQIKFARRSVDGINIYCRKQGEGAFRFLSRATKSPFTDPTPLTTAMTNTAEIREYQALGVCDDKEVGKPSHVVVVPSSS
jgi:hypothetical protein